MKRGKMTEEDREIPNTSSPSSPFGFCHDRIRNTPPESPPERRRRTTPAGFILAVSLLFVLFTSCTCFEERRCGTLDIRNSPKRRILTHPVDSSMDSMYGKHLNCTVMEGSFLMSMIVNENITEEDFPKFEHLREITGSVLIFQVRGLRSLRWIFPNLRVIGGQTPILHYSLIVYQNEELVELGLDELRVIRNGGVRIADNHRMCNAKSIDWQRLQYGPANDIYVDDAEEIGMGEGRIAPCETSCPSLTHPERCLYEYQSLSKPPACWGENACQLYCEHDRISPSLPSNDSSSSWVSPIGPGCADSDWSRCHEECVAGCTRPGDAAACHACLHISHGGKCIPKCPKHLFSYLDRRCITRSQCETMPPRGSKNQMEYWKASNGKCHYHCPENQEEDPDNPRKCRVCVGECHRKCPGNITIDSLAKAKRLSGCNVIEGFLEIEMRVGMDSVPAEELTNAFSRIQVIDGYLLIRLSPAFINLHMFKSLTRITGNTVYRNKYSVAVYENPNLQKLFPPNSNLTVESGHLQFHNNPMLCFKHIEQLMASPSMNRASEMTEVDQSKMSNGDKAICDESSFVVDLDHASATSFTLIWPPYNTTDIDYRKFLGYEVMYKEVPAIDLDLSIDDDRSACSDSWNTIFQEVTTSVSETGQVISDVGGSSAKINEDGTLSEVKKEDPKRDWVRVEISSEYIRPNTLYAYFVTTALVRHRGARNAVSKIGFVRTKFGTPEPPKLTKFEAGGTDSIVLQWDPPVRPNGEITHYVVSWRASDIEIEKEASRVCEKDTFGSDGGMEVDVGAADANETPKGAATSLFVSTVAPDTCAAKGCCACTLDPKTALLERQKGTEFENAVQNMVFVQQEKLQRRRKREIAQPSVEKEAEARDAEKERERENDRRVERIMNAMNVEMYNNNNEPIRINETGNAHTIMGLKHYTKYFVSVVACQNVSVPESSCSVKRAWKHITTQPIPSADIVDNSSISVEIRNGTFSDLLVTWRPPEEPNGAVLAYKIKVINTAKQSTPIEQCKAVQRGWSARDHGVLFEGLNDGDYRVEIRTISLLGISQPSSTEELFNIHVPGFWTIQRILITLFCTLLFIAIAGIVGYYFVKKYYGKKVKEYATQLISANPEYLSQNDVYKADHWEIPRDKLIIGDEIGKGTFGKVYRGEGDNITSQCGVNFGLCAIKTVTETANSAERLHFLLEAQVMKTFTSSFIVKLFGVVSDGQPTLVVMEMMDKGNLRDYLRSRRPDAEENTENLPVPHMNQYFEWAAQIADGMAYLESIRFCHRDLAARNCMVDANDTVKIGDFGMARDLYYHEYYKPTGKRLMPVRWMAPESLKDGRFDVKSDVWSYGIVLYEMLTLGQQPYQGLANDEVLAFIGMSRKILDRPMDCPDFWYDLMTECWKYQPKERPNFFQIVHHLLPFITEEFKQLSFVVAHPEVEGTEEEDGRYVAEGHGIMKKGDNEGLMNENEENGFMLKATNRGDLDEPGWGEGDSLAGHGQDGVEDEHEL